MTEAHLENSQTSAGGRIYNPSQASYAIDRWGLVRRTTSAERNLVSRRASQWEATHGSG